MAKRPLPDQALLLKLLRYDPETGKLFWRERTPDMFADTGVGGQKSACGRWNTMFANSETFCNITKKGYAMGCVLYHIKKAHSVIFAMHHGRWPLAIDHINGNRLDNRIENLRETTQRLNMRNIGMVPNSVSGCYGVIWVKRVSRWRAVIHTDNGREHLGYFDFLDDAITARRAAERKHGYHENHGRRMAHVERHR